MGKTDVGLGAAARWAALRREISAEGLGFVPREAVRWFAPAQLRRTAVKVALSTVLADYDDKRELQAAFAGGAVDLGVDPKDPDGLWFDFAADLGDGFDATYSVALLLAEPRLRVPAGDVRYDLPRGRFLIFGGDEVYPTPSAQQYEDRTKGPYRNALTVADAGAQPPSLLALPGNHDWYDGLTAFLRTFAQKRRIGGWQTRQTRSYWVARLPHGWWLAGLDTQFGGEIDEPQLSYFRENLSRHLAEGDQVVLCVASPTWVKAEQDPHAFDAMHYFERNFVRRYRVDNSREPRPTGAVVRLWLTGDLHHWSRYEEADPADGVPRQLITCGLGGAYLSGTHHLPAQLSLPPHDLPSRELDPGEVSPFRLRSASPDPAAASRRRWGLLWPIGTALPRRNPGFVPVIGGFQALLFVVLAVLLGVQLHTGPMRAAAGAGPEDVLTLALRVLLALAVVLAVAYFRLWRRHRREAVPRRRRYRPSFWAWAVGAQLLLAFGSLLLGATAEGAARRHLPWPGPGQAPGWMLFAAWLVVTVYVVGVVAAWLFALSLVLTGDQKAFDWQDSAQADEEHKGFLRLHLSATGDLTLYPVLAEKVRHDWTTEAGRLRPVDGLPEVRLIEPPLTIPGHPRTVPG